MEIGDVLFLAVSYKKDIQSFDDEKSLLEYLNKLDDEVLCNTQMFKAEMTKELDLEKVEITVSKYLMPN